MCGIFGYVNYNHKVTQSVVLQTLIGGLQRLEYRGYDSAGLCIGSKPHVFRVCGNVANLNSVVEFSQQLVDNHVGIAHTRWATHGVPCERNAHPQSSDSGNTFIVVHNGIISNYLELKQFLSSEYTFVSDTDTEVIAVLALHFYKLAKAQGDVSLRQIAARLSAVIEGSYAIIIQSALFPGEAVCARRGSPLLFGIKSKEPLNDFTVFTRGVAATKGEGAQRIESAAAAVTNQFDENAFVGPHFESVEFFLASDISAIIEHSKRVAYLHDDDLVHFKNGSFTFFRLGNADATNVAHVQDIDLQLEQISKGEYAHFMLKEIFEQPESSYNTLRGRVDAETHQVVLPSLGAKLESILQSERLIFIACGTSYHSALATRGIVEELSGIPVAVELASDFLDREPPVRRRDTCFFVSQSGETADTLLALDYCTSRGAITVAITNTNGSSMSRNSMCTLLVNAGPEISVASTKAYTSQMLCITMIALLLGQQRTANAQRCREIIAALGRVPTLIRDALRLNDRIHEISMQLVNAQSLLLIGRGYQFATCLEAALKVKEIAYIHSEGIMAGELKHGPLALIEPSMPTIIIATADSQVDRVMNAVSQVAARGGLPFLMLSEGQQFADFPEERVIRVPATIDCLQGLVNIIPLQLLSYQIAVAKGLKVDQPRNLAKSVTVV